MTTDFFELLPKWKYRVTDLVYTYIEELENLPRVEVRTKDDTILISLDHGWLNVFPRYCWDGASSLAIDTPMFMLSSCFHDALYQLCRTADWSPDVWRLVRRAADKTMRRVMLSETIDYERGERKRRRMLSWMSHPGSRFRANLITVIATAKSGVHVGFNWARSWWTWAGVRLGGSNAARRKDRI